MIQEKEFTPRSGWSPLVLFLGLSLGAVVMFVWLIVTFNSRGLPSPPGWLFVVPPAMAVVAVIMACGFMPIPPNSARALLLFGEYQGSVSQSGFYWVNPFMSKKRVSLRVRNFETGSVEKPEKKDAAGTVVQEKSRSDN